MSRDWTFITVGIILCMISALLFFVISWAVVGYGQRPGIMAGIAEPSFSQESPHETPDTTSDGDTAR